MKRLLRLALIFLTPVAYAQDASVKNPAVTQVEQACPVVWRGTFFSDNGARPVFSLTDSTTSRGAWLEAGEKNGVIEVIGYDRAKGILTLKTRDKTYSIRQAGAIPDDAEEPSLQPGFANAKQVNITGLSDLNRLSRARKKIVLRLLHSSVEKFDESVRLATKAFEEDVAKNPRFSDGGEKRGSTADPSIWNMHLNILTREAPGMSASVSVENYSFTGGAHGSTGFATLNFIGDNDTPATPSEMLSQNPDTLEKLSALSLRALAEKGFKKDGLFRTGLDADLANFSNMTITTKGIRIQFGDYQVTSHAQGTPFVDIPASDLNGVASEKLLGLWDNPASK